MSEQPTNDTEQLKPHLTGDILGVIGELHEYDDGVLAMRLPEAIYILDADGEPTLIRELQIAPPGCENEFGDWKRVQTNV